MYDTKYLLDSLGSVIESAKFKLSEPELQLLYCIREHIANGMDEEKVEKGFFDLVRWLLLIKEYLESIS